MGRELTSTVQHMGATVASLTRENQLLRDKVGALEAKLDGALQQILAAVSSRPPPQQGSPSQHASPQPTTPAGRAPGRGSGRASRSRACLNASATADGFIDVDAEGDVAMGSQGPLSKALSPLGIFYGEGCDAAAGDDATATTAPAATAPAPALERAEKAPATGPYESLSGKDATILFMEYMATSALPNLAPADGTRAKKVCDVFISFCRPDELKVLRPPAEGEEPDAKARSAIA